MIADPHELQRLRYSLGQDLLSRDFRDQEAFESELRWWHNRAAHGAFGVRYGLKIGPPSPGPDPTVQAGPGLAYDGYGRELILSMPRSIRVPSGPGETAPRVLVIRYRQDGAELAWVPAARLRAGDGVPLARMVYDGGEPSPDPGFHPPVARPMARPRLGRGITVQGGTSWALWTVNPAFPDSPYFGLQVAIDTRAAGFTRKPCYFAWVQGAIPVVLGESPLNLPLFPQLVDETPTKFLFRLLSFSLGSPPEGGSFNPNWALSMARQRLTVGWLGLQTRDDEKHFSEVIP
jgi:hypothetical protein